MSISVCSRTSLRILPHCFTTWSTCFTTWSTYILVLLACFTYFTCFIYNRKCCTSMLDCSASLLPCFTTYRTYLHTKLTGLCCLRIQRLEEYPLVGYCHCSTCRLGKVLMTFPANHTSSWRVENPSYPTPFKVESGSWATAGCLVVNTDRVACETLNQRLYIQIQCLQLDFVRMSHKSDRHVMRLLRQGSPHEDDRSYIRAKNKRTIRYSCKSNLTVVHCSQCKAQQAWLG